MFDWMKGRPPPARHRLETEGKAVKRSASALCGSYLSLYKYLENRYADTVVLTFAEMEALLGFSLPDVARLHQEWWTNADTQPAEAGPSHSWILASRTARPNLPARTVAFERTSP